MSQTLRQPQAYRPGLWSRLGEGLRYGGGIGQWSWFFHRITGLGILAFLVIHILDTFFVVAFPGLYDHTLSLYGGRFPWATDVHGQPVYYWPLRWAFRLGELGLIACVVFHAINGIRIVLLDFWPRTFAQHQRQMFQWVMVAFLVIMLVVSYFVFVPLSQQPEFWNFPVEAAAP